MISSMSLIQGMGETMRHSMKYKTKDVTSKGDNITVPYVLGDTPAPPNKDEKGKNV